MKIKSEGVRERLWILYLYYSDKLNFLIIMKIKIVDLIIIKLNQNNNHIRFLILYYLQHFQLQSSANNLSNSSGVKLLEYG